MATCIVFCSLKTVCSVLPKYGLWFMMLMAGTPLRATTCVMSVAAATTGSGNNGLEEERRQTSSPVWGLTLGVEGVRHGTQAT